MKKLIAFILGMFLTISAFAGTCNYTITTGVSTQSGTPTPDNPVEIISTAQGDITLRSVGNVADTYDANTGIITRNIGIVYLKDVNWAMSGKGLGRFYSNTYFKTIRTAGTGGLSNIFNVHELGSDYGDNSYTEGNLNMMTSGSFVNSIYATWNLGTTTLEQFQAMLESTNAYILYVMAEPTYENVGKTYTCHTSGTGTCNNIWNQETATQGRMVFADSGSLSSNTFDAGYYQTIPVTAGKLYTISASTRENWTSVYGFAWLDSNEQYISGEVFTGSVQVATAPANAAYIKLGIMTTRQPDFKLCESDPIKIATTAYNSARFSPVVTELNDTIATIRSVVTNTINQTAAIADLQATKQTRPDENCPAGKKCLLVEDDAGQPHWYEIIESASRLPDGYTELQYIESTGTQYFDTGIVGRSGVSVEAKFMLANTDNGSLLGNRMGEARFWPAMWYTDSSAVGLQWNVTILSDTFAGTVKANTLYTIYFTSGSSGWTFSANGEQISQGTSVGTNTNNMWMFGINKLEELQYPFKGKVYYAKIWQNGTLVRDFVPAKNSSGVIGMYDTVSGEFFTNKGSGTFAAGPEI